MLATGMEDVLLMIYALKILLCRDCTKGGI